jgi:hypothetical protein
MIRRCPPSSLLNRGPFVGTSQRLLAPPLPSAAFLPQISLARKLCLTRLGFQTPPATIPFIQIRTRMAPKAPRQKGKGAVSGRGTRVS